MAGQLSPWPSVRRGAKEHPVPSLQYLLRARGLTIEVDGTFGSETDAAVRDFQERNALTVDGVVGPNTWRALVPLLRQGDRGDAVRAVQEEFRFRDLSGDPAQGTQVDGIFGPQTDAAVRAFQEAVRHDVPSMTVDGLVGPMTWQALVSGMLSF